MKRRYLAVFVFVLASIPCFSQSPGFFLNDHQAKEAVVLASKPVDKPTTQPTVSVTVDFSKQVTKVSKYLYGNNANVYMTQMVDQPVLIDYIKNLSANVIRFPGGNLSSVYFWNAEKNVPPADAPSQLSDANGVLQPSGYWYGKNSEGWTLSVDNYYEMLKMTNSTGIITINYGYARYSTATNPVASAAHLAAEWVRYDKGRTKFWEIGNESNGTWQAGYRIKTTDNKDGQPEIITGELYGKHFKVFADSMRKAATEVGATIYIGAQLLQEAPASWWSNTDRNWNSGVFAQAQNVPDYYIVHSYYTPYQTNSKASDILTSASKVTDDMMAFLLKSQQDAGVTLKPIALTEWNIFAEGSKQQVSYINGMHAAITLGHLIKNKYGLAARWDLANGWGGGNDHGMFNQGDEPGGVPKWNPRAAFYYMYYFQKYFGDAMIESSVTGSSDVMTFASSFSSGESGIVVINKGTSTHTVAIDIKNFGFGERYYVHTLRGGSDNGEFSLKVSVNGQAATYPSGGPVNFLNIPADAYQISDGILITLPGRTVSYVLVEDGSNVITDIGDGVQLEVFPNPAKGKLTIKLPSAEFSKVEVIDVHGRSVMREYLKSKSLEYTLEHNLNKGVYYLRLHKGKSIITRKIVID